jgi:hypothetical protein
MKLYHAVCIDWKYFRFPTANSTETEFPAVYPLTIMVYLWYNPSCWKIRRLIRTHPGLRTTRWFGTYLLFSRVVKSNGVGVSVVVSRSKKQKTVEQPGSRARFGVESRSLQTQPDLGELSISDVIENLVTDGENASGHASAMSRRMKHEEVAVVLANSEEEKVRVCSLVRQPGPKRRSG